MISSGETLTVRTALLIHACVAIGLAGLPGCKAAAAQGPAITLQAGGFSRADMTDPLFADRIRKSGSLGGGPDACCITGTVEYTFESPGPGWFELVTTGGATGVEFTVGPASGGATGDAVYSFLGGTNLSGNEDKIGMVWLDKGTYRLRARRHYWTGFPQISAIHLRPGSSALQQSLNISPYPGGAIHRLGQCRPLRVRYGPLARETVLELRVREQLNAPARVSTVRLPATAQVGAVDAPLPCDREGTFLLGAGIDGHDFSSRDVRWMQYEVYGTTATSANLYHGNRRLVAEIDAVRTAPDFSGGGAPRVSHFAGGTYRESGATGFTAFQRAPALARLALPEPGWFAYRLSGLTPQKPHLVEVEYPDDALRTFGVQMRETRPLDYPVSIAIDTGGEYAVTNRMARREFIYWPRTTDPRITFATAHDGRRAAVARIRVHELGEAGVVPASAPAPAGTRQFVHWYEEGLNFLSLFGAPARDAAGQRAAITRWFDLLVSENVSTVFPTVLVYGFALYPSRFNLAFSGGDDTDTLRRMLLLAEPRHLKVVPEFHPRADELVYGMQDPAGRQRFLLSKDGGQAVFQGDGKTRRIPPYFNPLDPEVQDWYVSMIGEMADAYSDSPSLAGVSLRVMHWFNGALNNLVSLDWGYDAMAAQAFQAATGIQFPPEGRPDAGNGREAAQARFRWLTSDPARRAAWLAWRSRQITRLVERIRDRVRRSRTDLVLYLNVFDAGPETLTVQQGLLERGLDVEQLARLDGVRLVNSLHGYGRREKDAASTMNDRERLLDPSILNALRAQGQSGNFITSARYLEVTSVVTPPASLDMPKTTPLTWASLAANPAGDAVLERLAIPLAEADAQMLGDGGNQYVFGNPAMRAFVHEFRQLPAIDFTPHPAMRDPVALWSARRADGFHFYLVNRERFPVRVSLQLIGSSTLTRPAERTLLKGGEAGRITVDLPPFALRYFRGAADARVSPLGVSIPAAEQAHARALANWIGAQGVRTSLGLLTLTAAERKLLDQVGREVASAAEKGETWRARTLLERSSLLPIYRKLGEQPPGWTDR